MSILVEFQRNDVALEVLTLKITFLKLKWILYSQLDKDDDDDVNENDDYEKESISKMSIFCFGRLILGFNNLED